MKTWYVQEDPSRPLSSPSLHLKALPVLSILFADIAQKTELVQSEAVLAYLGGAATASETRDEADDEDFS